MRHAVTETSVSAFYKYNKPTLLNFACRNRGLNQQKIGWNVEECIFEKKAEPPQI